MVVSNYLNYFNNRKIKVHKNIYFTNYLARYHVFSYKYLLNSSYRIIKNETNYTYQHELRQVFLIKIKFDWRFFVL